MTPEEFERGYAARSEVTVDDLRAIGRVVCVCTCGEDGCEGWMSISRRLALELEWPIAWPPEPA